MPRATKNGCRRRRGEGEEKRRRKAPVYEFIRVYVLDLYATTHATTYATTHARQNTHDVSPPLVSSSLRPPSAPSSPRLPLFSHLLCGLPVIDGDVKAVDHLISHTLVLKIPPLLLKARKKESINLY